MSYEGVHWTALLDRFGNYTIINDGREVCYLQGDDPSILEAQLEPLETITYPSGPFKTVEEHIDVILDAYGVLEQH